jgi:hypothetical protein
MVGYSTSATANTEYPYNIATGYTSSYYCTPISITVSNTTDRYYSDMSYSSHASPDYYSDGRNSDVWNPPPFAPKIDIKRDRPNKPLVHNRCRHIAPMHFRHVRTQQRKV